jgi:hypothetical protein
MKDPEMAPCRRCGHERREHVGVFVGPVATRGCEALVRDDQGWATGACGCSGYEARRPGESLGDALIANIPELPPLRIVAPPPSDG